MIEEMSAEDPKQFPVATICRMLKVSKSGFYEFTGRQPSARAKEDTRIAGVIEKLRGEEGAFFNTYGSPRMHAELRLAHGFKVGRKRVERVMREHGWAGSMKRKRNWGKANAATAEDRVNRDFTASKPNQLWFTDITEHHTRQGKVYCAVALDAFSRLAIGWSISSRMTADLVVDALQMARWRRLGASGVIMHSDRGSQFTSWAFTSRVHEAGILASMGTIGDCYDNAMMESFWSGMQLELLDTKKWATKDELATAMFSWIEGWYNPRRRHSALDYLSPAEYEKINQSDPELAA